jgi:dipeptidase
MDWARSAKEFNFARDYGDYWRKESPDPGRMQIRRNTSLALCQAISGKIDPAAMMKFLRNHHEGTSTAPRWGVPETFWATLCMHDNPKGRNHTAASEVCHLRESMPPLLRQVYWASFSNPCCNVFKPLYLHGTKAPANYAQGTSTYSADSPWWWANRIKLLCDLNYPALNPWVRGTFDETEKWILQRQPDYEAQAMNLLKKGNQEAAVALLQKYLEENFSRIEREYKKLNEELPSKLDTTGIKFLFLDYLKEWTSKKGVPLPLQN